MPPGSIPRHHPLPATNSIVYYPVGSWIYTHLSEGSRMMDRVTVLRRIDAIEQLLQDLRSDVLADDRVRDEVVQVPGQGAWRRPMLAELYPYVEHLGGVIALF